VPIDLPLPRRGGWSLWLAIRATFTGAMALVALMVVRSTAWPRLTREYAADSGPPAPVAWLLANPQWLIVLPMPAIALGLAALIMPAVRGPLAILASAAALLTVIGVIAILVAALLPMYQAAM